MSQDRTGGGMGRMLPVVSRGQGLHRLEPRLQSWCAGHLAEALRLGHWAVCSVTEDEAAAGGDRWHGQSASSHLAGMVVVARCEAPPWTGAPLALVLLRRGDYEAAVANLRCDSAEAWREWCAAHRLRAGVYDRGLPMPVSVRQVAITFLHYSDIYVRARVE